MTDDNPFHRWKAATARQQPLNFEAGEASATPEPAHPATELVSGVRAGPWPRRECSQDAHAVRTEANGAEQKAGPEAAPVADVEVVMEPASDPSSAPWWAAKSAALTRQGFYPPVPVAVAVAEPPRSAPDEADDWASFIKRGRTGRGGSFVARLLIECSRPRALLALIGVVVAGIVGMNAWVSYRAAKMADAEQGARALAVNHSLALLDQPVPATPAAPPATAAQRGAGVGGSFAAVTAADAKPDLSADSVEAYVRKAMPRLTGAQPAAHGQGPVPREVQDRPLPSVGVRVPAGAPAVLPKKAPIADTIDESVAEPVAKARIEDRKRQPKQSRADKAHAPAKADTAVAADPLSRVLIQAALENPTAPFRLHEIRQQRNGLGAYVLSERSADLGEGVWVHAGHVFANGWTLAGVERRQVLFVSPEGQVVPVAPSPVE